tara:strand:- start:672 stop:1457 length:786 start_codon:yes stop_codon:yes gene_type:complete
MISLILGDSVFPNLVIKKLRNKSKDFLIIDLSKDNKFKNFKNSFRFSLGQFGSMLNLIKKKKSKKVLFAGKINKPKFSSLKLDLKGILYMPKIIKATKKGDAAIIKSIIEILDNEKIKVIKSNTFNPELTISSGVLTKIKPTVKENKSILKGINFFKNSNKLDHVQALIIKDQKIIASEIKEGTKKTLSKIPKNSNGVLIKFPKKNQDLRVDLPTIGFETLKDCKKKNIKGIILKSKQNIFLDKKKSIQFANKNNMFIKAI